MPVEIINLLEGGSVSYHAAWEIQRERAERRKADDAPDALFLLEHPPTVTYGKAADRATNLLLTPEEYEARGIELIETDRGGDVTYHGPGQLVGYPVIYLGEGNRDLHKYVRRLETVLIEACDVLGAKGAGRASFHAGVWAGDGYVAALGVRVSRWVTMHGFALNVSETVRGNFAAITPCGVAGKRIATVSELAGRSVSVGEAASAVTKHFLVHFDQNHEIE